MKSDRENEEEEEEDCINIDDGVLKRKIQVYSFQTLTWGPSVKSRQLINQHCCLVN